ncbi:SODC-like protein [Mya arenaria]|uniref:SODC-like protein n=1 Tax=Mya arenaria TaxID=6604 RepID=A0ABY7FVK1_MYAAR|nr:SODC-like protein [Mya arenaria]
MAPLARLAFLLGVFLLLQDVISAKRPKGKGKMKQKLTDGNEEIRNIKDKLAIIEAKLDGSSDSSAIKDDHFAHADFSNPDDNIIGFVQVQQNTNERGANFYFEFSKLPGNDAEFHVHVHEFGDVSDNCNNIGGHYDPILPDEDVGNLGHIETNSNSAVEGVWKNGTDLTIYGDHSIVGRSIAIHESDGTKIACAVIGWCSENTHHHHD